MLIVFAVVPLLFVAVPLVRLLSATHPGDLLQLLQNPDFTSALGTSLIGASLTTVCALIFGLPLAFLLASYRFPGRQIIEALLLIPLVLPPLVGGIAELQTYGPETLLGQWFGGLGMPLTDSLTGVVLAQAFITSPFMILAARAGFAEIPYELIEATRILGGSLWTQFWSVSIPLARQAIGVGILLTFARAFGEFGATMIMAYHPHTVPVQIWVTFTSGGLSQIISIAALLLLISLLIVLLTSWVPRTHHRY